MDLDDLSARLDNVKQLPSGRSARCPAHDDRVSSLMLNEGRDGGLVVKCHAGCRTEDVMSSLGLSIGDLMGVPRHAASYEYVDAGGAVQYTVERWVNPKTFRCVPGLPPPAQRVLYQLPAIEWARDTGALLYYVEGEKDADRIIAEGHPATTNVTGAGGWLPHYADMLRDCHCIIVADNDAPGRAHARAVAAAARGKCATLSLMVPRYGKDVSELLNAGYTLDQLDPLSDADDATSYQASGIRPRSVSWAWTSYFALGKLSIVEGDPGDGKSILTLDLAARWSTGAPMPDGSNGAGPWPVILVSAEDDMDDTIVPRLIAAGARLDDVILFPHGATPELPFEFATDLSTVERRIVATGAKTVIFDPLTAFLSERTDSHNDASVRRALQPLKMLAQRTLSAVIVVRHLNKGGGGTKAIYRGGGSIGFTGAARSTFLVAPDPTDPDAKIFASVKSNLSRKPPSLRYVIETTIEGVPYVSWRGLADETAQSVLDGPKRDDSYADEEASAKRRIRQYEIEFLRDVLADGPMTWKEIADIGKQDGFSEISLRRARADMGLIKLTEDVGTAKARWSLRVEAIDTNGDAFAPCSPQNKPLANDSKTGEQRANAEANVTIDDDRDAVLEALPLVCQTCGTSTTVRRYFHPYYRVACDAHNPMDYEGN